MNHRIKKKLKKKASKSMIRFDAFRLEMVPTTKTYREIKLERKKIHDSIVRLRHLTYQYKGYGAQLRDARRLRREYAKAFDEKMKRHFAGIDAS